MLLCALFSVGWVASLICMQIRYGGVGREPGCPTICRRCCPKVSRQGSRKQRKKEVALAKESVEADADNMVTV